MFLRRFFKTWNPVWQKNWVKFCSTFYTFSFFLLFYSVWVHPESTIFQNHHIPAFHLPSLTSRFPSTTGSCRKVHRSSGGPRQTRKLCFIETRMCFRSQRCGNGDYDAVAMPTAAMEGATWWGWGVSWAPVKCRTSAIDCTSWLDRAGRKTRPPSIHAVLTATAKFTPPGLPTQSISICCLTSNVGRSLFFFF